MVSQSKTAYPAGRGVSERPPASEPVQAEVPLNRAKLYCATIRASSRRLSRARQAASARRTAENRGFNARARLSQGSAAAWSFRSMCAKPIAVVE